MGGLLFVAHDILEAWAGQGRIDLDGSVLSLRGGAAPGRSYRLEAAVRFLRVEGAEADPHGLLRRVKSEARLRELGAELLPGAVVLGDVAYAVEQGFLAEAEVLQAAAAAAPGAGADAGAPPEGEAASGGDPRRREAEALARFLLENIS